MEHFYSTYFFNIDTILSEYFSYAYNIIQYYVLLVLNNCPFYYQMVYGYAPLTYILIRRRFKKNNYKNYFDKSNFNWIFFNIKLVLFRATKLVILYNYVEIFFKKIYYYISYKWSSEYTYKFIFFKNILNSLTPKNIWKPTFKKYSYFGIFAFLRSKWFK